MISSFFSEGNLYLIPNYIKDDDAKRVLKIWEKLGLSEHVFIFSSGTGNQSSFKTYALSKSAIINNAMAVNRFLEATKRDIWFGSLPIEHIGGLSIHIRAQLSQSSIIRWEEKWNVISFYQELKNSAATLTSLVPTQLYDLVKENLKAPKALRGVFLGGDFCSTRLKDSALELGWPLICTYGMTENCSQIASTYYGNSLNQSHKHQSKELMQVLEPFKIVDSEDHKKTLISNSLYTGEILISKDDFTFFKREDTSSFLLPDNIYLETKIIKPDNAIQKTQQWIKPLGRTTDEVKIKGRLFILNELRDQLESVFFGLKLLNNASYVLEGDERLGQKIFVLLEESQKTKLDDLYQELLKLPFMDSSRNDPSGLIRLVNRIDRTLLGKVKAQKIETSLK